MHRAPVNYENTALLHKQASKGPASKGPATKGPTSKGPASKGPG